MSDDLKVALDDYFAAIKEDRANYKACYSSFCKYCENHPYYNYGLKELFNHLTRFEIEQACKEYFISSKKATGLEAIRRFLSAIDMFYIDYLVNREITCKALEKRCRNQEVIKEICRSLNHDFKQKILLPLDSEDIEKVNELANRLDSDNFFQLGQKIIYRLLLKYGFKERIILDMQMSALNIEHRTLSVCSTKGEEVVLEFPIELFYDLKKYIEINPFTERNYLFTRKNGKKLNSTSVLETLKSWADGEAIVDFTPTSIALSGIVNLIDRNLSVKEICILTGFEIKKVSDVAEYLLTDKDISWIINHKLNKEI